MHQRALSYSLTSKDVGYIFVWYNFLGGSIALSLRLYLLLIVYFLIMNNPARSPHGSSSFSYIFIMLILLVRYFFQFRKVAKSVNWTNRHTLALNDDGVQCGDDLGGVHTIPWQALKNYAIRNGYIFINEKSPMKQTFGRSIPPIPERALDAQTKEYLTFSLSKHLQKGNTG